MSKEKIIVALDVATAEEAHKNIELLRWEVGAFKIGLQLFTAAGSQFVREVVESGIKLFLDLKFHDIPNTVAKASIEAARSGVWMFNLHTLGGSEMMRRAVGELNEACAKENLARPKLIGVTVLTSSTGETLKEIGIEENTESQVLKLAQLALNSGLDGVVASPLETQKIRDRFDDKNFLIVTPGVRSQKRHENLSHPDDQKRIMTPGRALSAGADYLVIGRPILAAEDPLAAAREILAEIEGTNNH